jgi:hypothetical protein
MEIQGDDGNGQEPENGPTIEGPLPPLMSRDDPQRMLLTSQERQWAIDIKNTIEMMPDTDNLTDFQYAQFGLITQGDYLNTVNRIVALEDFREEYKVTENASVEEAMQAIERAVHLFPGLFLTFQFSAVDGTYCLAADLVKFDANVLQKSPRELDNFNYLCDAMTMDLESIRKGVIRLYECEGLGWGNKATFQFMPMIAEQFHHYPIKQIMKYYHTGVIFNALAASLRKSFPAEFASPERFAAGLELEVRLDALFLTPTREDGTKRFLNNIRDALQRRHDNEQSFSLNYNTW